MNAKEQHVVSRVKGFIEPIFVGTHTDGKPLFGVGPDDWQRIKEGYACGNCLAIYDTYLVQCPVCKQTRDVMEDIPPPQDWLDRMKEWQAEDRGEAPIRSQSRSALEAIYGVGDDPDVEQIELKKLRKRRR